jgi:mannose PTS system EIIA component
VIKGVLVTHGTLGAELIRTAEGILGPQEGVAFISNADASLEALSDRIRDLLAGSEQEAVILFVDLVGGSCSHACARIRAQHEKTVILAGVNLPMLLDFFYNRELMPVEVLAPRLLQKGKDGIRWL